MPCNTCGHTLELISRGDGRAVYHCPRCGTLRMVDGWCRVNRSIGKWLIVTGLTALIALSGAWDAIRNLLGWKH